ncbi:hypothetical protein [Robbsia andropogonis]|uniref:hypothetical protein n=1 Tax=Robbsia andropogonis TaxID=28092 RepID=UPI0004637D85|nr:hypothetical protein [Robbsia andropogonis]
MTPNSVAIPVVLFGDWKIRHQEPLGPADHILHAVDASDLPRGAMTVTADLRGMRRLRASWNGDTRETSTATASMACANFTAQQVPLAIAMLCADNVQITHLVTRIDLHRVVFVQPTRPIALLPATASLAQALVLAFEVNYLEINNWECRYAYSNDTFIEHFELDAAIDARTVGEAWYDAVDCRQFASFVTQSGDEFQLWDHDVTVCRAIPTGYVHAEHWSRKRKNTVNEPLAQLRCIGVPGTTLPTTFEAHIVPPVIDAIAATVDVPLQTLGEYRRIAFSTACESVETGHIFTVMFETCVPRDGVGARTTRGHVSFVKTRGKCDTAINAELLTLARHVRTFLHAQQLDCLPARPAFAFLQAAPRHSTP